MPNNDETLQKQREYYRKKYKYVLNPRRKMRYKTDIEYKQDCIVRSREYRHKTREFPLGTYHRVVGGVSVVVYSRVQAAELIGCTVYRIKSLEQQGVIPKHMFKGKRPMYTRNQVEIIRGMCSGTQERPSTTDWENVD